MRVKEVQHLAVVFSAYALLRPLKSGLGKIDDTVLNCTVDRSILDCNWHEYGIDQMQILARSPLTVRVSTMTELNFLLLAHELPLIIHRRLSSWCARIVEYRDIYSLACR